MGRLLTNEVLLRLSGPPNQLIGCFILRLNRILVLALSLLNFVNRKQVLLMK